MGNLHTKQNRSIFAHGRAMEATKECRPSPCRITRSLLLLLIVSALLLLYWLTPDSFISMQTIAPAEYNDNISTRNVDGISSYNTSSETFKQQIHNTSVVDKPSMNVQPGRARLHLIIQFPVLGTSGRSENDTLVMRQKEYIYCLQRNLLSPHVQEIHILCESDQDSLFVQALNLRENWKLVIHLLGRRMRYKDAFEYASKNLLRKNTMIMNADCYIDKGFENLDERILSKKTMYALTRHETREHVRLCNARDFCGPTSKYIGSHDAFLFRLLSPVSPELLERIDYRPNIAGIEKVLIFNFSKYGRFRIKNPCKILHIVHHHCSRKRNNKERHIHGQRIDRYLNVTEDKKGKLVMARFSGL